MRITHQNWRPDTCGCCVEEEYDMDDPQAVMTCSKVIIKCAAHASVPDADLFGVLYANPDGENKVKNLMHKHLVEHPALNLSKDSKDGLVFNEGVEYVWSFSGSGADRVLNVGVKGAALSAEQKQIVKDFSQGLAKDKIVLSDN